MFNEKLLDYLACPDCGKDVELIGTALRCSVCRRQYEIKKDIPIMLPSKEEF